LQQASVAGVARRPSENGRDDCQADPDFASLDLGCLLRNFDLPDGIKDIAKQLFLLRDSLDRNK
jgi:hypothetical protein